MEYKETFSWYYTCTGLLGIYIFVRKKMLSSFFFCFVRVRRQLIGCFVNLLICTLSWKFISTESAEILKHQWKIEIQKTTGRGKKVHVLVTKKASHMCGLYALNYLTLSIWQSDTREHTCSKSFMVFVSVILFPCSSVTWKTAKSKMKMVTHEIHDQICLLHQIIMMIFVWGIVVAGNKFRATQWASF